MTDFAIKDPYAFPGGVVYTRIVRSALQQGWQDDSHAQYLASPGLSASALKVLGTQTPAHFKHSLSVSKDPTPAMIFGTKAHDHVLLGTELAPHGAFDRRTKDGKALAAAAELLAHNSGHILVSESEFEALTAIRRSVHSHPLAGPALECGAIETSGYAQTEHFAVKIRPDIRVPETGVIWDLKTCASASPEAFARDAFAFGYHVQAAWYLAIAEMIDPGSYHTFRFIAAEKDAPYLCAVYEASPDQIALGSQIIERAVDTLTACIAKDAWPGFGEAVSPLELPRWALKQLEGA